MLYLIKWKEIPAHVRNRSFRDYGRFATCVRVLTWWDSVYGPVHEAFYTDD